MGGNWKKIHFQRKKNGFESVNNQMLNFHT